MTRIQKNIFIVATSCSLLALGGCAAPADPSKMVVQPTQEAIKFPPALNQAMCVRKVDGGETTNPMWASKVSNQDFKAALVKSMNDAGLNAASDDACKYHVDVSLLGLSQPALGLDITVTSHVNYKVYDPNDQPVALETINAEYTAKFSDAFVGTTRLKLANEGSIRESISQFFGKLRAAKQFQ